MDIEQLKSLPEKLRRLVLGQEAAEIGRGGVSQIARKYNVSRTTVTKGKKEYLAGEKYSSETGSRKPGGGRKCITEKKPEITTIIIEMIEKENGVYGDPMTERKWTTLSERKIARFLKEDHEITISSNTVGRILKNKFSRQQNRKMKETGKPDPDRNQQFKHIGKMRKLGSGWRLPTTRHNFKIIGSGIATTQHADTGFSQSSRNPLRIGKTKHPPIISASANSILCSFDICVSEFLDFRQWKSSGFSDLFK